MFFHENVYWTNDKLKTDDTADRKPMFYGTVFINEFIA